jgi:hypothetical protein
VVTRISVDISGWQNADNAIKSVLKQVPAVKGELLRNTVGRYRDTILTTMLSQGTRWTGTYQDSVGIESTGTSKDPELAIIIDPQGRNADRLPIYWKVLEFGSQPIWNLGRNALRDWVTEKVGGDEGDLARITNSIRSYGISPHPVLSSIFILAPPDGEVLGLTPLAISIAEEEAQKLLDRLMETIITISRTGQVQARYPKGTPGGLGGRFRSVKS